VAHGSFAKFALVAAFACWCAFWFWAFSFAYSPGFFRYHAHTRIPTLIAALIAMAVVPVSAFAQWRSVRSGKRGRLVALLLHVATTCCLLAIPFGLTWLLSRATGPWHLEADEAMGAGIDNALLLLVSVVCAVVLGVLLVARTIERPVGADRNDA
jgi:hypothetical protein